MEEKSVYELATRLNDIMVIQNQLAVEYNTIVSELKRRYSKLEDDPNLKEQQENITHPEEVKTLVKTLTPHS